MIRKTYPDRQFTWGNGTINEVSFITSADDVHVQIFYFPWVFLNVSEEDVAGRRATFQIRKIFWAIFRIIQISLVINSFFIKQCST